MATDQSQILSAEARTRQRDQAASELVRGLLIINGGGGAALLAFLQAIWPSNKALAKPTIIALVIFSLGAASAATFHYLRHEASWFHQSGDTERYRKFELLYRISAFVSLSAFVIGVIVIAVGAWNAV
jgi:hypothetical protein